MTKRLFGRTLFVTAIAVALVLVFGLLAFGCSNSDESSSTTVGAGSSSTTDGSSTGSSTGGAGDDQSTTTSAPRRLDAKSNAEYQAEIPDLQKTLENDPNDLATLQELAIAQYSLGQLPDAATTYQKMLAIKDDPTTHNNYGNVLRDEGLAAEAIIEYHKAIAGDKTLTVAYVNLAGVYVGQKKLANAKEIVQRGITATTGEDQASLKSYLAELNKKK